MKLEIKDDLKIFCVSIKQDTNWGIPLQTMAPLMGQFLLAYSQADLVKVIADKFPPEKFGVMQVHQHGLVSFKKMVDVIDSDDLATIPVMQKVEEKPQMSKDQFLMNIMLVADDLAPKKQAKILKTVIKEIKEYAK